MNRRRIIGLVLLAGIAMLLAIRGYLPIHRVPESVPAPPREAFDKSKAFVLTVLGAPHGEGVNAAWLARELNTLVSLAGLHVIPAHTDSAALSFELKVVYSGTTAQLQLLGPDKVVERAQTIALPESARLQIARELIAQLLRFLRTSRNADIDSALDFDDASFESLTQAVDDMMGSEARGFSDVGDKVTHAAAVTRLERIAKQHAHNPEALSALALGYLSVGGPDHQSLLDLAEQRAQQALAINQHFADAHAALGLAALRRNEWVSARESLDRATNLNPNSLPALEGLACLFANAGQLQQAADYAQRALAIHAQNVGAQDCLNYAQSIATTAPPLTPIQKTNAAVLSATTALLEKDFARARELLSRGLQQAAMKSWGEPLIEAAQHPARVPTALQRITEAAAEHRIESTQVLLAGLALRKADFVFNRLARIRIEHEPEPTRVLWLRQASFLRAHTQFEQVVADSGLPAYWHEYGRPDVCKTEPTVYGCGELSKTNSH